MQRYFLQLSYKGTAYKGWQIQPKDNTVQGEINKVLTKLNRNIPVFSMGCGRTDTGVHASKFYAHFDFVLIDDILNFKFKMNNMLPRDIVIHDVISVQSDAHTRFDALYRTYNYFVSKNKNAFNTETTLLFPYTLDLKKMNQACLILFDYIDFECFSKVKTDVKTFDCTITEAKWENTEEGLVFIITANRFLRNMVRAIVGTLIEVGQGKIDVEYMHEIIKSKKRDSAGKSVSANGLFLADIKYEYL
jgi:tRNA pseudouridine38-40 synthase